MDRSKRARVSISLSTSAPRPSSASTSTSSAARVVGAGAPNNTSPPRSFYSSGTSSRGKGVSAAPPPPPSYRPPSPPPLPPSTSTSTSCATTTSASPAQQQTGHLPDNKGRARVSFPARVGGPSSSFSGSPPRGVDAVAASRRESLDLPAPQHQQQLAPLRSSGSTSDRSFVSNSTSSSPHAQVDDLIRSRPRTSASGAASSELPTQYPSSLSASAEQARRDAWRAAQEQEQAADRAEQLVTTSATGSTALPVKSGNGSSTNAYRAQRLRTASSNGPTAASRHSPPMPTSLLMDGEWQQFDEVELAARAAARAVEERVAASKQQQAESYRAEFERSRADKVKSSHREEYGLNNNGRRRELSAGSYAATDDRDEYQSTKKRRLELSRPPLPAPPPRRSREHSSDYYYRDRSNGHARERSRERSRRDRSLSPDAASSSYGRRRDDYDDDDDDHRRGYRQRRYRDEENGDYDDGDEYYERTRRSDHRTSGRRDGEEERSRYERADRSARHAAAAASTGKTRGDYWRPPSKVPPAVASASEREGATTHMRTASEDDVAASLLPHRAADRRPSPSALSPPSSSLRPRGVSHLFSGKSPKAIDPRGGNAPTNYKSAMALVHELRLPFWAGGKPLAKSETSSRHQHHHSSTKSRASSVSRSSVRASSAAPSASTSKPSRRECAILVTGYDPLQYSLVRSFFVHRGATQQVHLPLNSGGEHLSAMWIEFRDTIPGGLHDPSLGLLGGASAAPAKGAQDGQQVARLCVAEGNGKRLGTNAKVVTVVLDPDRSLCAAAEREQLRLAKETKEKEARQALRQQQEQRKAASPTMPPKEPPPPPPQSRPPWTSGAPPPPPPISSKSLGPQYAPTTATSSRAPRSAFFNTRDTYAQSSNSMGRWGLQPERKGQSSARRGQSHSSDEDATDDDEEDEESKGLEEKYRQHFSSPSSAHKRSEAATTVPVSPIRMARYLSAKDIRNALTVSANAYVVLNKDSNRAPGHRAPIMPDDARKVMLECGADKFLIDDRDWYVTFKIPGGAQESVSRLNGKVYGGVKISIAKRGPSGGHEQVGSPSGKGSTPAPAATSSAGQQTGWPLRTEPKPPSTLAQSPPRQSSQPIAALRSPAQPSAPTSPTRTNGAAVPLKALSFKRSKAPAVSASPLLDSSQSAEQPSRIPDSQGSEEEVAVNDASHRLQQSVAPRDHTASEDESENDQPKRVRRKSATGKLKRKRVSKNDRRFDFSSSSDEADAKPAAKKAKKASRSKYDFTSSEDEAEKGADKKAAPAALETIQVPGTLPSPVDINLPEPEPHVGATPEVAMEVDTEDKAEDHEMLPTPEPTESTGSARDKTAPDEASNDEDVATAEEEVSEEQGKSKRKSKPTQKAKKQAEKKKSQKTGKPPLTDEQERAAAQMRHERARKAGLARHAKKRGAAAAASSSPAAAPARQIKTDADIKRSPRSAAKPLTPLPPLEPVPLDADVWQAGVVADEEDAMYAIKALENWRLAVEKGEVAADAPGDASRMTIEAAWDYRENNEADEEDEEVPHEEPPPPRHQSGSARTEGYYKVSAAQKLADRGKGDSSVSEANRAVDSAAPPPTASGVATSRLARANTRGLVRGMEMQKKTAVSDTDVLKFNQLRTRKKQLHFARSGIHDYGLFAMEPIPRGEMVIEYVGEMIRAQVADRREQKYERQGIGSSYLFRVDDDLVVDATKKGNLGRLINHCCVPNCTARIITINGEKKIVIYAKANIDVGEEITYDYHFPHEEVKIPCLCGHPQCRKYLN